MDATNKEFSDGFLSLAGGMHGGLDPLILSADAGMYHKGVNVTARNGTIQTRPAFVPFSELPSGKFQGAFCWKLESVDRLVFVVAGHVYSLRTDTMAITDHGKLLSETPDRVNYCQAFKWAVLQDGINTPVALEEDGSGNAVVYTRPTPYANSDSPPSSLCLTPGTVMTYAHGRIHYVPVSLPAMEPLVTDESDPNQLNATPTILAGQTGKASFVSSDVLDIYVPEFLFRMTEHRVLNEGGAIELPAELGFIHGMTHFRNAATGTGVGGLLVFGREGLCAFDMSLSRTEWKKQALGQVLFSTVGTKSPHSLTQINNDVGFLDTEGKLRTVRFEGSSVSNSLTSLPLSFELTPFHYVDVNKNLELASMNLHDNRLTWTMNGNLDGTFKSLASLDFAKVYALGKADTPSFDGIWTGFNFQQTLTIRDGDGERRHLVIVKDGVKNIAYVLDDSAIKDDNTKAIRSIVWTRYMDFQQAVDTKVLKGVELWLSGIATTSTVWVYFRPRGCPGWSLVGTRTFNVPGGEPQYRRRVLFNLGQEDVDCCQISKDKLNIATHFQFALVWTGRLKFDRLRAVAALRQDPFDTCVSEDNTEGVELTNGLQIDDFEYSVLEGT